MKSQIHTAEAGDRQNFPNTSLPFGFNPEAEWLNGRLAMLGLIAALLLEWLTGQSAITWLTHL
ncbi:MAG: hypothetical protein HC890_15325 [Chloroflexaceae bacterium]|nr:hypothetical protein [Chloroflexaceae bacterium]